MIRVLSLLVLSALSAAPAFADDDDDDKKVAVEAIPPAVRASVERLFPGATLLEAELEHGRYEIELRAADNKRHELKLEVDGSEPKAAKIETKGEEEEEDDD